MSKFSFGVDWASRASIDEAVEELKEGRLPGRLGLIQQIVGHWVIRKEDRGVLSYGKAALDTLGSLLIYREKQKKIIDGGKDPSIAWLTEHEYQEVYPNAGYSFTSFVGGALSHLDFTKQTVRDKSGKPATSLLLEFDIAPGKKAFYIDLKGNSPKKTTSSSSGEDYWGWEGPFAKPEDFSVLVEFIRTTLWKQMGTSTLLLSCEQLMGTDRVQISSIYDDFDFCSAKDAYNDVRQLAARCKAFMDTGRSRNLLFYGPPGTGKSTLARAIARHLNKRVVIVEHDAINQMSGSAHRIIGLLRPGVLVLNDVDRGRASTNISLLQSLEREHVDNPLLICVTVNDISRLDPALLRPGRIHETREIPEPSDESRAMIFDYYIQKFGLNLTDDQIAEFMAQTTGFSPADTREFCETSQAVGTEIALQEIPRIVKQRELYAGDACKNYNARLGNESPV